MWKCELLLPGERGFVVNIQSMQLLREEKIKRKNDHDWFYESNVEALQRKKINSEKKNTCRMFGY